MLDAYSDRICAPEETVARMRPVFAELGITRIARQTGLDAIGIPCFASFRPNSHTLSTNQGKGLTDAAAMASAVMEAVEFAVAESPRASTRRATINDLEEDRQAIFWPSGLLPSKVSFDIGASFRWVQGETLKGRRPCWVPLEAVQLTGMATELAGICQTTNGLASGNTREEAVFHALCELVERDAYTEWFTLSAPERRGRLLDMSSFDDPALDQLVHRVEAVDLKIRLYDQTGDTGIPVIMAAIADLRSGRRRFDMAAGYGAHPVAARAAIRAVTEAAQTRITSIASARDDILPAEFGQEMNLEAWDHDGIGVRSAPPSIGEGNDPATLLCAVTDALILAGVADPIVVELDGGELPCSVVRLLSSDLEDLEANSNWRPGKRARAWLSR